MYGRVITLMDLPKSVEVADRCISSAANFGIQVTKFNAITPKTAEEFAQREGIPMNGFKEKYSRFKNALAAFCSHYSLWKECLENKQPMIIFEHDAIVVSEFPGWFKGDIVNCGAPSYGMFNTPTTLGEGPLQSKTYLPGAHAYFIKPSGARKLISAAKDRAKPTDIFIGVGNFKVNEVYPWPAKADDSFTTIQREDGIQAKHNFQKNGSMEVTHVRD